MDDMPRSPKPVDLYIGNMVRTFRRARGVSQGALAQEIGVSFQQVQKYEKGVNRVPVSYLMCIADALDLSILAFLPEASGVSEDQV